MEKREKAVSLSDVKKVEQSLLVDQDLLDKGNKTLDQLHSKVNQVNSFLEESNQMVEDLLSLLTNDLEYQENFDEVIKKANTIENIKMDKQILKRVNLIDTPEPYLSWDQMVLANDLYAEKNGIDLDQPFINSFSNIERVELYNELTKKFDIIQLDKYDYLFATAAGVIAGFIDAAFVGTISNNTSLAVIPKMVDTQFDKIVTWYGKQERIGLYQDQIDNAKSDSARENLIAKCEQLKAGKKINSNGELINWSKKDSIKVLEKNHRVSYDAAMTKSVQGMSPDNHHLFSIAHEPSLLGLLVGIVDQLTGKTTFIDKSGTFIRESTGNLNNELTGNFLIKISQATENWFGHIMSDISGSSSSKGRGSGLPVPGWSALQKLQIGNFNNNGTNMNVAGVSEWMFKNGYDVRSFTAQLIPVIIYETLVRCYWFYKQHIYFGKSLKESFPVANNRELSRLLLFSASSFTTVDVTDATIKSTKTGTINLSVFLMTINVPGILNLGFRSVQNIKNEIMHKNHVTSIIQNDVIKEYERVLNDIS